MQLPMNSDLLQMNEKETLMRFPPHKYSSVIPSESAALYVRHIQVRLMSYHVNVQETVRRAYRSESNS